MSRRCHVYCFLMISNTVNPTAEDQCCQPLDPSFCGFLNCTTNSCVPDLCKTIGQPSSLFCEIGKNKFVTINQLYSGLYMARE